MQGRVSKDDMRQQVAQVTLEIHKLRDNVHDLREVFEELENLHAEAGGCCFPFKYIMLRDLVLDADVMAGNLQHKWYGATDQSKTTKRSRGVVSRLLDNCRAFTANRQALDRYGEIMEDLKSLKHGELEQTLLERQTTLAQQKVVFTQLQDLLKQMQDLHHRSQDTWLLPRYLMLKREVHNAFAAYHTVAGLAESAAPQQSSGHPAQTDHSKG